MTMANKGDHVYFHRNGEPCSGEVLAAGQHGCTVEHGGKKHKLRWDQLAGHKSRAPQNYKVIEEGEDGIIVAGDDGKKRFFAIPPEAKAEGVKLADQK